MQYVGGDRKAQSCRFHRHLLSAQTRFPYHNFSQKLTKCILYLAQVLRQIMEQKFIPDGGCFGISFLSSHCPPCLLSASVGTSLTRLPLIEEYVTIAYKSIKR